MLCNNFLSIIRCVGRKVRKHVLCLINISCMLVVLKSVETPESQDLGSGGKPLSVRQMAMNLKHCGGDQGHSCFQTQPAKV